MAITVNLRYTGKNGSARKFAEEMTASGTVAAIRAEAGNLRYEYYQPLDDPETILLIDSWEDQSAIDAHHATPMMATIAGTNYAFAWMNGETDGTLDLDVLNQCMYDYAGMNIDLQPYTENGVTYDNYLLFLMDYLTYGDLPEMTDEMQANLDIVLADQAAAAGK